MRKSFYLSVLFIGLSLLAFSQAQRLVLLEHFTQASCGPCATYNPAINTLLNANPDKITAIMYHTSWPGVDPMYNHNTVENGARTSYYSVNSVPNSVLDGNVYNGHPNGWSIATVDNRYSVPSPFDVYIYQELSADQSTFHVTMMIVAAESVAAGMKAHMAVIEKHIHFNSPPGSNGEVDFYNVMKKLLPNQSGVTLPAFELGEYVILEYSWEHQNVYSIDELAAVGFIQNNGSKEVLQSANSSDELFSAMYDNDVEVTVVDNVSLTNCNGKIQPQVTIRNNGSAALTSVDIKYSINGEEPVVYSWTGNLDFLESETVMLDESTFAVEMQNTLEVVLENPNGETDEYMLNNQKELTIESAPQGDPTMVLYMILDDNPEEITWEVTNYEGDILYEGGPYSTPGQTILEQLVFESTNCYTFTIYDEGGDGLSQGGSIAFGYGTTYLINEVDFGSKAEAQFRIEFTGVTDIGFSNDLNVYPNPAQDLINVSFSMLQDEPFHYSIVNTMSQVVLQGVVDGVSPGVQVMQIDCSGIEAGVYFIQIKARDSILSKKIIITNR